MAVVRHAIQENDVVALRERVGPWPAGTVGTAISIYDEAALVEVPDEETGEALDTFVAPAELLEIRPRHRTLPDSGIDA
jgi:hypothetical protein